MSIRTERGTVAKGRVASFRDPSGRVILNGNRILRVACKAAADQALAFLATAAGRQFTEEQRIVATRVLSRSEASDLLELSTGDVALEHGRVWFPSYPYEWPAEMLHKAAELTLDLAFKTLGEGFGLKDATPYNVLFQSSKPVFVDLLSIERRQPRDPIWLPYAQFLRTFALPLLVNRRLGVPLDQVFLSRRDGLEALEVYRWASPFQRLSPPFLGLVTLPTIAEHFARRKEQTLYQTRLTGSADQAAFILRSLFRRLRRIIARLRPATLRKSRWSEYAELRESYEAAELRNKQQVVCGILAQYCPQKVLDIGCNTGRFSAAAARLGSSVVAVDADSIAVGRTWSMAAAERLSILPLVVDIARPTPGTGWTNSECESFLGRARGAFDAVLMLAVSHHLLVTERIPLALVLDLAADMTKDLVIYEWVGPGDPMFRRIARGRLELHKDLTTDLFESIAASRFEIARKTQVARDRWVYALRKRLAVK